MNVPERISRCQLQDVEQTIQASEVLDGSDQDLSAVASMADEVVASSTQQTANALAARTSTRAARVIVIDVQTLSTSTSNWLRLLGRSLTDRAHTALPFQHLVVYDETNISFKRCPSLSMLRTTACPRRLRAVR